jgi:hypothetical protein
MTRHGTLAYYLTVWVVGCFFMTFAVLAHDAFVLSANAREFVNIASNFIFVYFFGLIYGATTALLYGFVLRRLMSWSRAARIWQWILAGSILVIPFFFAFRRVERFQDRVSSLPALVVILTGGELADLTYDNRILLPAILAGAMTSAALFYVHRAFAQESQL